MYEIWNIDNYINQWEKRNKACLNNLWHFQSWPCLILDLGSYSFQPVNHWCGYNLWRIIIFHLRKYFFHSNLSFKTILFFPLKTIAIKQGHVTLFIVFFIVILQGIVKTVLFKFICTFRSNVVLSKFITMTKSSLVILESLMNNRVLKVEDLRLLKSSVKKYLRYALSTCWIREKNILKNILHSSCLFKALVYQFNHYLLIKYSPWSFSLTFYHFYVKDYLKIKINVIYLFILLCDSSTF